LNPLESFTSTGKEFYFLCQTILRNNLTKQEKS